MNSKEIPKELTQRGLEEKIFDGFIDDLFCEFYEDIDRIYNFHDDSKTRNILLYEIDMLLSLVKTPYEASLEELDELKIMSKFVLWQRNESEKFNAKYNQRGENLVKRWNDHYKNITSIQNN